MTVDVDEEILEAFEFGVQRPRFFVLDSSGVIRHRGSGYTPTTADRIRSEVEALLDSQL